MESCGVMVALFWKRLATRSTCDRATEKGETLPWTSKPDRRRKAAAQSHKLPYRAQNLLRSREPAAQSVRAGGAAGI
jgi:hypothetical protein